MELNAFIYIIMLIFVLLKMMPVPLTTTIITVACKKTDWLIIGKLYTSRQFGPVEVISSFGAL